MRIDSYVGKICPYCKSEFKEGDNIVQCNQCDAVLHAECWEANRGCTTFDCQGSPAGTWHINEANEANQEGPVVNTVVQVEKDLDSSLDKFGSKSQTGFKPQLRNDKLENMTQPEPQAQPQPVPQPQPVVVAQPAPQPQPAAQPQRQPAPQPQRQPQQATRICYSCGAVVAADKAFCTVCGNEMDKVQPKPTVAQSQYNQPQYQQNTFVNQNQGNSQPQFYQPQQTTYRQPQQNHQPQQSTQFAGDTGILDLVEKNLEYYGPKFSELRQKDSKISWNWASFLFGAHWLFYRKMYTYGAAYLGISLIISFMGIFGNLLSIVLSVALGMFGNWLYMDHLGKVIEKTKAEPSQAETLLTRHRGASYAIAIVVAVAWFIFLRILHGM